MQKKLFKNNSIFISLAALTLIGLLIRIISLSDFPNGFARDEAYLGYNAFSILKTGIDINGNSMPLFLESFLYTPAGYSYLSIPFIFIFELSPFSVRFASALFGTLTIPFIYLLIVELMQINKASYIFKRRRWIGITGSALLAITPWHINLSRTASVSTVVTFFTVLGVYLLFLWIKCEKQKFIILSFLSFLITLFFYIAPYSFIPFLLLLFFLIYKKQFRYYKYFFIGFFIILIPIFITYLNPLFSLRVQSLSLTKHPILPIILTENANRDGVVGLKPIISRMFHNKISVLGSLYTENYFNHLSFNFFFTDKAFPDRYRVPEVFLIYPILLIFLILGIYTLLKSDFELGLFLLGWVLISPIGSAFANDDVPNMQRTLFMLIPLIVLMGTGIIWAVSNAKFVLIRLFMMSALLLFLYQISFYFHQYLVHANSYRPWYRQEGYEALVNSLSKYENGFQNIVVTNRESAPTLLISFFKKYDPILLQDAIKNSTLKDTDRISFGKYMITEDECPLTTKLNKITNKYESTGKKNTLYVNSGLCKSEELPDNAKVVESIKRSDGSVAFVLLKVN